MAPVDVFGKTFAKHAQSLCVNDMGNSQGLFVGKPLAGQEKVRSKSLMGRALSGLEVHRTSSKGKNGNPRVSTVLGYVVANLNPFHIVDAALTLSTTLATGLIDVAVSAVSKSGGNTEKPEPTSAPAKFESAWPVKALKAVPFMIVAPLFMVSRACDKAIQRTIIATEEALDKGRVSGTNHDTVRGITPINKNIGEAMHSISNGINKFISSTDSPKLDPLQLVIAGLLKTITIVPLALTYLGANMVGEMAHETQKTSQLAYQAVRPSRSQNTLSSSNKTPDFSLNSYSAGSESKDRSPTNTTLTGTGSSISSTSASKSSASGGLAAQPVEALLDQLKSQVNKVPPDFHTTRETPKSPPSKDNKLIQH